MNNIRLNNFYFVEDNDVVILKDNGILEISPYKNMIKIDQIRKVMSKYPEFVEFKEFEDWYLYKEEHMEISLPLQSESDYYDTDGSVKLKEFLNVILNIWITINKPLSDDCLDVVAKLLEIFHLNLYNMVEKKHYKNIEEFMMCLKRLKLV